jgi:hypothetical protein
MLTGAEDVQRPIVAVAATPDAPWSSVAATLDGVSLIGGPEGIRVSLVFEKTSAGARGRPPGPSKIDKELAEIRTNADPGQKATKFAALFQKVIDKCPQAKKAMATLAGVAPEEKEGQLKEALPHAIADCKCKCDMDSLRALLWALLASDKQVAVVKVSITAAGQQAAATVALPGATPWSEAYRKVIDAHKAGSVAVQVQ